MSYEYGVEYPCNGEKPDLPDDVLVEIWNQSHNKWLDPEPVSWIVWVAVVKFRIVDERWKPENKNDWYEKGEFPPEGERCEYLNDDGNWQECVFRYADPKRFRPLRTEEDELIDKVAEAIHKGSTKNRAYKDIAIALYDEGLLRKP